MLASSARACAYRAYRELHAAVILHGERELKRMRHNLHGFQSVLVSYHVPKSAGDAEHVGFLSCATTRQGCRLCWFLLVDAA